MAEEEVKGVEKQIDKLTFDDLIDNPEKVHIQD
jgi:hypothetical protein